MTAHSRMYLLISAPAARAATANIVRCVSVSRIVIRSSRDSIGASGLRASTLVTVVGPYDAVVLDRLLAAIDEFFGP